MLKRLALIVGLVAVGVAMPAYAKPSISTYKVSRAAMVAACNRAPGGIISGGGHSGCDIPCAGGKMCDIDCVGNDCTVTVFVAGHISHDFLPDNLGSLAQMSPGDGGSHQNGGGTTSNSGGSNKGSGGTTTRRSPGQ